MVSNRSFDINRVIVASVMIIMMQIGFAVLEVGSVRQKNTSNILLKNVIDTMAGAIVFYFIGFSLMSDLQGGIIG